MSDSLLRRPNGRPQACDPCRSRKVACDHTQPICNRCRKRNQDSDCVYTSSTHSVSASSRSARARAEHAASSSSSRLKADHTSNQSDPVSSLRPGHHTPTHSARASNNHSPVATCAPGYLGFTSYNAVYEETRDRLSSLRGTPISGNETQDNQARIGDATPALVFSPTLETALIILRNLPDLSAKEIPPRDCPHPTEGWGRVAAQRILKSLRDYLPRESRLEADLQALAQMICRNTTKPVDDNLSEAEEWIGQFTGQNLRWEGLGLLFSFRELFSNQPERGSSRNERYQSAWKQMALWCVNMCIDLSMHMSGGNLMLLYVCYQRTNMESMAGGDACLPCWRSEAECASLLTFLGLHAEHDTPNYIPTFCSELRRRLFAYCFNSDKLAVSFQGRPPLLSGRHASMPLPLDIAEEDFFSDAANLRRVASSMDKDGWNMNRDKPCAATMIRARVKIAYLKDEVMEIALGNSRQTHIDILLEIKARQAQLVAEFPPSLTYNPQDLEDLNITIETVYSRTLVQIEQLQNIFFIERLLLRRGHPDSGELLRISYEMVTLTLTFWLHKDRFIGVRADFEWLVMAYAAPGGGILCLELLKPTNNPNVRRSAIIQQLSLLVGFLAWVSPGAPNADLCANCRTVIQHVLDHTLNGIPHEGGLGHFDANEGFFNFDLLDTFGWLRAEDVAESW